MKIKLILQKIGRKIGIIYSFIFFKIKHPSVPIIRSFRFNDSFSLTYYSQSGQDVYLSSLLFNILNSCADNFYIIDIGCNHPEKFSNTFFFEKFFGCQVIAIDPLSELEPLWKSARPKATFIPTAIGTHEDTMRLKIPNVDNMFSTLEGGTLKLGGEDFHERLVKVQRLSTIIDSFDIKNILFISIDVEGFELDVLKSINFDVVDIKCFLVENNSHDPMGSEDVRNFLSHRGFIFCARFNCLDDLFISKSCL